MERKRERGVEREGEGGRGGERGRERGREREGGGERGEERETYGGEREGEHGTSLCIISAYKHIAAV